MVTLSLKEPQKAEVFFYGFVCCSASDLRCESVVVRGLAGEQDVRKALLLPDHDVAESTVALILSHVVSEPLVKHVAFLLDQLPLVGAV